MKCENCSAHIRARAPGKTCVEMRLIKQLVEARGLAEEWRDEGVSDGMPIGMDYLFPWEVDYE